MIEQDTIPDVFSHNDPKIMWYRKGKDNLASLSLDTFNYAQKESFSDKANLIISYRTDDDSGQASILFTPEPYITTVTMTIYQRFYGNISRYFFLETANVHNNILKHVFSLFNIFTHRVCALLDLDDSSMVKDFIHNDLESLIIETMVTPINGPGAK